MNCPALNVFGCSLLIVRALLYLGIIVAVVKQLRHPYRFAAWQAVWGCFLASLGFAFYFHVIDLCTDQFQWRQVFALGTPLFQFLAFWQLQHLLATPLHLHDPQAAPAPKPHE